MAAYASFLKVMVPKWHITFAHISFAKVSQMTMPNFKKAEKMCSYLLSCKGGSEIWQIHQYLPPSIPNKLKHRWITNKWGSERMNLN